MKSVSSMMLVATGAAAACSQVAVAPEAAGSATRSLRVDLGIMSNWNNSRAADGIASRAAFKACGLPASTGSEAVKLQQTHAVYNLRGYRFACPDTGEAPR